MRLWVDCCLFVFSLLLCTLVFLLWVWDLFGWFVYWFGVNSVVVSRYCGDLLACDVLVIDLLGFYCLVWYLWFVVLVVLVGLR